MSPKRPHTLGQTLKTARKKKGLSLSLAEEETKVRIKYLEALEEGHYETLPANVYSLGFLAKYGEFLNLKIPHLIDLFKKERGGEVEMPARLAPDKRIKEPFFTFTPRIFTIVAIIVVVVGVLGYIIYSVKLFTSPPVLEIGSPSQETVIKEAKTVIKGKTDTGATLTINGELVFIDDKGNFSQEVRLRPGLNSIEIKATNRQKKETIKVIKILAEYCK